MAVSETQVRSATASAQQSLALPDLRILLAFLFMVFVAGGASIAIRITFNEMPPFWSGGARFGLAALIFWILMLVRKVELPRGKSLAGAALFGLLGVGASFLFSMWGLVKIPVSLFQVIGALIPLLTILFAFLHRLEKVRWQGITGALLAVAGIALAVNGYKSAAISIPHLLAIVVGTAFMAEAAVIAKMTPRSHPIATNAVGMTVGSVMLLFASLISGEEWVIPTQTSTWMAYLYLVVCVSVIVFLLYLWMLERWTASGTSFMFVLMPLVTILLASWMFGEPITLSLIIGAALVIGGVLFGALLKPKRNQKPAQTYNCPPC